MTTAVRVELTPQCLLAVFTECDTGERRSVVVARETLETGEPPALVLVEGLEFVLHLATEGDLTQESLLQWLMSSYCYSHYEQRNYDTELMEANARSRAIGVLYPELETQWRAMTSDEQRAVHFLALEQCDCAEQLLKSMLSLHRQNLVSERTQSLLERQIETHGEYKRQLRALETVEAVQAKMQCDWFFFVKSLCELPPVDPAAKKLAGARVWRVTFADHTVMEYFVDKLRHPIEIGGQLFPRRVEGTKVGVTVLDNELQVFSRRNTVPHDYTLRQLPKLGAAWQFSACKRQLFAGVLEPAVQVAPSPPQCGLLGADPFTTLCHLAQPNAKSLASHLFPVELAWLHSAVLLVDSAQHTEVKLPVSLGQALQPQPHQSAAKQPVKRKADDDEVVITGSAASGYKKRKFSGGKPLVQARLTGFTSYTRPGTT